VNELSVKEQPSTKKVNDFDEIFFFQGRQGLSVTTSKREPTQMRHFSVFEMLFIVTNLDSGSIYRASSCRGFIEI
jgi:hypothetical protein